MRLYTFVCRALISPDSKRQLAEDEGKGEEDSHSSAR